MSYRFTSTEKWTRDAWFIELKPLEKLLFIYLCENCDIAGIIEISTRKFAFDLNCKESEIKGALKNLERGYIWSLDGSKLILRKFIYHQKNIPLNPSNRAHAGIIKILEENIQSFGFQNYDEFFNNNLEAPSKPLERGYGKGKGIGIGNGQGQGNGQEGVKDDPKNEIQEVEILDPYAFEELWSIYDKKVGNKEKLKKKWDAIPEADRIEIFNYLPKYITAQPDKKYRKNLDTFLNNKSWKDEIINTRGQQITDNRDTFTRISEAVDRAYGAS